MAGLVDEIAQTPKRKKRKFESSRFVAQIEKVKLEGLFLNLPIQTTA